MKILEASYPGQIFDIKYDEELESIILILAEHADISMKATKKYIASCNNVIVDEDDDTIDGDKESEWYPSEEQMMNALRVAERNIFNTKHQHHFVLTIDANAIKDHMPLFMGFLCWGFKVQVTQPEFVY